MNQFRNIVQISNYNAIRPRYTSKIFKEIKGKTKTFKNYLDIACGTGQPLIPLSQHFEKSFGIDVSPEQINKATENSKGLSNVHCYTIDIYETLDKLTAEGHFNKDEVKMFDLITIGQAFHWFDAEKLLQYINDKLLASNGLLIIAGYKKQHFKQEDKLFQPFEDFITKLKTFFECDVDFNDSG
jgi:SAM-dependent methyltransferase